MPKPVVDPICFSFFVGEKHDTELVQQLDHSACFLVPYIDRTDRPEEREIITLFVIAVKPISKESLNASEVIWFDFRDWILYIT